MDTGHELRGPTLPRGLGPVRGPRHPQRVQPISCYNRDSAGLPQTQRRCRPQAPHRAGVTGPQGPRTTGPACCWTSPFRSLLYLSTDVRAELLQSCPPVCGQEPTRLLCPWDSPSRNTGVGCHALPQGLFLTQELNPRLSCLLALAGRFFTTSSTWEALSIDSSIYLKQWYFVLFTNRLNIRRECYLVITLCQSSCLFCLLLLSVKIISQISIMVIKQVLFPYIVSSPVSWHIFHFT